MEGRTGQEWSVHAVAGAYADRGSAHDSAVNSQADHAVPPADVPLCNHVPYLNCGYRFCFQFSRTMLFFFFLSFFFLSLKDTTSMFLMVLAIAVPVSVCPSSVVSI